MDFPDPKKKQQKKKIKRERSEGASWQPPSPCPPPSYIKQRQPNFAVISGAAGLAKGAAEDYREAGTRPLAILTYYPPLPATTR